MSQVRKGGNKRPRAVRRVRARAIAHEASHHANVPTPVYIPMLPIPELSRSIACTFGAVKCSRVTVPLMGYADSEEVRNALESKSLGVQYYSTSDQTQSE